MKPTNLLTSGIFIVATALLLSVNSTASAQENVIALARVNTAGTVLSSANTVNGVVNCIDTDIGEYVFTVASPGAFSGASSNDFVVETTISSTGSGDTTIKSHINSVTDDLLTITVRTDDVEDPSNGGLAEARDQNFYIVIHRIPTTTPASSNSRFLISTGKVSAAGLLESGVAIDGTEVSSTRPNSGDYRITLTNTGEFSDDAANDYILSLTVEGASTQDQVIRGGTLTSFSDDQVVFNVHIDDVQDSGDNNTVDPANNAFFYTIYRVTDSPSEKANSRLLLAHAKVASSGVLQSTPFAHDGGTLSSIRNSTGDYRVTITSPGAFAGMSMDEIIPQVFLSQSASADEAIMAQVSLPDSDTLHIDVNTNDLEQVGAAQGVAQNASFFLVLMKATGEVRPDLKISNKRSLSSMKGNDIYNTSGGSQQIRLKLAGKAKKKFHFLLENDGDLVDTVTLREKGSGKKVKTRYFRITGGRTNVTGKMIRGKVTERVQPEKVVRYQGYAKYVSTDKRPKKKFRILSKSLIDASKSDTNRVKVKSL